MGRGRGRGFGFRAVRWNFTLYCSLRMMTFLLSGLHTIYLIDKSR